MPIKSKRQWRYLAANRPDLLKKWQRESPVSFRRLPVRKKKKTLTGRSLRKR